MTRVLWHSQVRKHVKAQGESPGGVFSVPAPTHYSNVSLIDPVSGYVTPLGVRVHMSLGHPPARCRSARLVRVSVSLSRFHAHMLHASLCMECMRLWSPRLCVCVSCLFLSFYFARL